MGTYTLDPKLEGGISRSELAELIVVEGTSKTTVSQLLSSCNSHSRIQGTTPGDVETSARSSELQLKSDNSRAMVRFVLVMLIFPLALAWFFQTWWSGQESNWMRDSR